MTCVRSVAVFGVRNTGEQDTGDCRRLDSSMVAATILLQIPGRLNFCVAGLGIAYDGHMHSAYD